jgi:type II secretory pathway pseudopilin PulG
MLLDLAPKDTDLALEFPLFFKDYARDVMGQIANLMPAAERQKFDAQMSQPVPQLGVSIRDIFEKTDARVGIYLKLDPSQKIKLSPQAPELPALDGVIVIERLGWLLEKLKPQIVQMFSDPRAPATLTDEGGVLTIKFNQPAGPPPMDYTPVLRFDAKADRLVIASRAPIFDAVVAGTDKFSQRADFAGAWRDLPSEGNACLFASSRLLLTVGDLIGEGMKASKSTPNDVAMVAMFADWLKPLAARSQALIIANQSDGVLMTSNTSVPLMGSSLTAVSVVAVLAGTALPAFTKIQERAAQTKEINNARQVIMGLKIYAADNGGKYPGELSELITAKVLDNESLLSFTDPVTKEHKAWLYNNKLNDSAPGSEAVIASPSLIGGKRIVGFNDGSARLTTEEEFKKLRGEN